MRRNGKRGGGAGEEEREWSGREGEETGNGERKLRESEKRNTFNATRCRQQKRQKMQIYIFA